MIYLIGYYAAFIGIIVLLVNVKSLYEKINLREKIGLLIIIAGIIIPMLYGFIDGFLHH